jgi:5'-phosphate synthase pdxT subunit
VVINPRIGVLALQGDFGAHLDALALLDIEGEAVRYPDQLEELDGIILPGGESTTHLKLLKERGMQDALLDFHKRGRAVYGTCAGAILIAATVKNPTQPGLALIDIDVERNGFGRQAESFESTGTSSVLGPEPLPMVFIRAPRIRRTGPDVAVIAGWQEEPVLVRQENVLAGTFHPELTRDARVHRYFAEMAVTPSPVVS